MALSWHVDYWDHLGWKDPFGRAEWTGRQRDYARALGHRGLYTPMLVVMGRMHTADAAEARRAIARHLEAPPAAELRVEAAVEGGKVRIRAAAKNSPAGARAFAAVAEDGLVTRPSAGENRGRRLAEGSVVRALLPGRDAAGELEWEVEAAAGWKLENLRAVVFLQDPATLRVHHAAQAPVVR